MDIQVIASGSSGNSYRIDDGKTSLLLDAGIPIQKLKKALDYRLSAIDGVLVSHEHQDHCKAVKDILRAGIDVYMSQGTKNFLDLHGHRIHIVKSKHQLKIRTLTILPLETQHDATEPLGFVVQSGRDKLLYATDTYYFKYKVPGLTHIMVECNYDYDILQANIALGKIPDKLRDRLLQSHFSLGNVKEFMRANDLSHVQEIYLMHLSNGNSDEAMFKREIQELTGRQVIVC